MDYMNCKEIETNLQDESMLIGLTTVNVNFTVTLQS